MKTETEHLLYFSVPGSFIIAFMLFFLVLVGWTDFINSTYIALIVASVIPIGYATYQGYAVSGCYEKVWRKWHIVSEPALDIIERLILEQLSEIDDDKLKEEIVNQISRRYVLNFFEHNNLPEDSIDYIWRLINIINSRGVGIFSCLVASTIPIIYVIIHLLSGYLEFLPSLISQWPVFMRNMGVYYFVIIILLIIFNSRLAHIKRILSDFSLGTVLSKINIVETIVSSYISFNTIDVLVKRLEQSKDDNKKNQLIEETSPLLIRGDWKSAYKTAIEIYGSKEEESI